MAVTSARAGQLAAYRRGVTDAIRGARAALATRRPITRATRREIHSLHRLKPSLIAKVRRHLKEQLI